MVELNPLTVASISGQTVVAYTVRVSSLGLYTRSNVHLDEENLDEAFKNKRDGYFIVKLSGQLFVSRLF